MLLAGRPRAVVVGAGKYSPIFQAGAQRCTGGRNIAAVQVAEKGAAIGAGKRRDAADHAAAGIDGGKPHPQGLPLACKSTADPARAARIRER